MTEDANAGTAAEREALVRERHKLLTRISDGLEGPMMFLGLVWLGLVVASLTGELSPFFAKTSYVIWGLFVLQFLIELTIAPTKTRYLRRNWITVIALLVPAFRLLSIFRIARAFTVLRGAQLVRVVGSANRSMKVLGRIMDRRGFGYVLLLTVVIGIAGGAGLYALESGVEDTRYDSFWTALWWSAMTLTTMSADWFPVTPEGRILALLLAVYGFAVFGYVTATVASYFVARDADEETDLASARQIEGLRESLAAIHAKLDARP